MANGDETLTVNNKAQYEERKFAGKFDRCYLDLESYFENLSVASRSPVLREVAKRKLIEVRKVLAG